MTTGLEDTLHAIDDWGADHAATAFVGPDGVIAQYGDIEQVFRWASITKLATALAILAALDDGSIGLDEPAGPPGSTVRHLLAHASGLSFDGITIAAPGTRRIYSNAGFDVLGTVLAKGSNEPFIDVLTTRVLAPLGMNATVLDGQPSSGLHGPLRDLVALARELLRPTIVSAETMSLAATVAFPGLKGLLPGVGTFDPHDWGLGFELRDAKIPHWTATANSAATFGHFGGSGTFIWVDPVLDRSLVCLTDRDYGPWALEAWPAFSDDVISTEPVAYSP